MWNVILCALNHIFQKTNKEIFKLPKTLETPIKGKHVYIVDDILDSGNTMAKVIEYLEIKWPKSINVVTLLKRKNTPFKLDNYGVEGTEMSMVLKLITNG
jgi:hypoxanthine phosphoribosyltransferase